MRRYERDLTILNGKILQTNESIVKIRNAVKRNRIPVINRTLKENERLDVIAGQFYGDGSLWWIIAAASEIGWWLQAPAGTSILIPTDINSIYELL